VFSEEELGSSDLSPRQKQNRAYAERGRGRLCQFWGEVRDAPLCVLAELGRIQDDAKFREAAWWYDFYARDLTAKQAAARIKQMRLGTTPQEGPATLYKRLMRTWKTSG
jgi:DNA-binding PucR family transcriptional regulator